MSRVAKRAKIEARRQSNNELIQCPACGRQTPFLLINQHLDLRCSATSRSQSAAGKCSSSPVRRSDHQPAVADPSLAIKQQGLNTSTGAHIAEVARALMASAQSHCKPLQRVAGLSGSHNGRSSSPVQTSPLALVTSSWLSEASAALACTPTRREPEEGCRVSGAEQNQERPDSVIQGKFAERDGAANQQHKVATTSQRKSQTGSPPQHSSATERAVLLACPGWQEGTAQQQVGELTSRCYLLLHNHKWLHLNTSPNSYAGSLLSLTFSCVCLALSIHNATPEGLQVWIDFHGQAALPCAICRPQEALTRETPAR